MSFRSPFLVSAFARLSPDDACRPKEWAHPSFSRFVAGLPRPSSLGTVRCPSARRLARPVRSLKDKVDSMDDVLLAGLFFLAAVLYSSVGHAGASGYLAAMALVGLPPAVMKPTALSLNILVATITTIRFARAGCFSFAVLWTFAVASIPMAYLGGRWTLPDVAFKPLVGVVLIYAAYRLAGLPLPLGRGANPIADGSATAEPRLPSLGICLAVGGLIGLLSGLTGTGGGIFLSPVLILMNWADVRKTAGVSAAFILVNSIAGLAGNVPTLPAIPSGLPLWLATVAVAALIGSELGARRMSPRALRMALAVVLVIAGAKLILFAHRPASPPPPAASGGGADDPALARSDCGVRFPAGHRR